MKIQNTSNQVINLSIVQNDGKTTKISLAPGEISYQDLPMNKMSRAILIQQRKGNIKVTDEKPESATSNKLSAKISHSTEIDKSVKTTEPEIEIEIHLSESSRSEQADVEKTKGKKGRPFGSTKKDKTEIDNTPKRPRGRPFGSTKKDKV